MNNTLDIDIQQAAKLETPINSEMEGNELCLWIQKWENKIKETYNRGFII